MLIIGITGAIGHGKSTLAAALTRERPSHSRHYSSFEIIASVAEALNKTTHTIPESNNADAVNKWLEPLPGILAEIVHAHTTFSQVEVTDEQLKSGAKEYTTLVQYLETLREHPEILQKSINEIDKEIFRPILQWLGGSLVARVDKGIWYKEIVRRIHEAANEGCEVCTVDGLRYPEDAVLMREAHGIVVEIIRPDRNESFASDPTESSRAKITPDAVIINNGTTEQLSKAAHRFFQDALDNTLQPQYPAVELKT